MQRCRAGPWPTCGGVGQQDQVLALAANECSQLPHHSHQLGKQLPATNHTINNQWTKQESQLPLRCRVSRKWQASYLSRKRSGWFSQRRRQASASSCAQRRTAPNAPWFRNVHLCCRQKDTPLLHAV